MDSGADQDRYPRRLRDLEVRNHDPCRGDLAPPRRHGYAARRRGPRLDGCSPVAAPRSSPRRAGKAGGDVDGAARDGSRDRAADVRRRREGQLRSQPRCERCVRLESRIDLRSLPVHRASGLAVHPGAAQRVGGDRRNPARRHRGGHGASRRPQHCVVEPAFARVLLQPEQAARAWLRCQPRRDALPAGAVRALRRGRGLAVRAARRRRGEPAPA